MGAGYKTDFKNGQATVNGAFVREKWVAVFNPCIVQVQPTWKYSIANSNSFDKLDGLGIVNEKNDFSVGPATITGSGSATIDNHGKTSATGTLNGKVGWDQRSKIILILRFRWARIRTSLAASQLALGRDRNTLLGRSINGSAFNRFVCLLIFPLKNKMF